MAITVTCDECSAEFRVKDEHAGRRMKCRECGTPVRVPDADDEWDDGEESYDEDEYDEPARRGPSRSKSKSKKKGRSTAGQPWYAVPPLGAYTIPTGLFTVAGVTWLVWYLLNAGSYLLAMGVAIIAFVVALIGSVLFIGATYRVGCEYYGGTAGGVFGVFMFLISRGFKRTVYRDPRAQPGGAWFLLGLFSFVLCMVVASHKEPVGPLDFGGGSDDVAARPGPMGPRPDVAQRREQAMSMAGNRTRPDNADTVTIPPEQAGQPFGDGGNSSEPPAPSPNEPPQPVFPDDDPAFAPQPIPQPPAPGPQVSANELAIQGMIDGFAAQHGAEKVVVIHVTGMPLIELAQLTPKIQDLAGTLFVNPVGQGATAMSYVVAPVADIKALSEKISFGKVTEVDTAKRTIRISGPGS